MKEKQPKQQLIVSRSTHVFFVKENWKVPEETEYIIKRKMTRCPRSGKK